MGSALAPATRWFDLSRHTSVASAIDEATFRCRSNPFLIETDRGKVVEELTYRAFREQVQHLAAALLEDKVGPGVRVAILMPNGPRYLIVAAAAFHVGAVVVPLDARLDAEGQARLLQHCRPAVLFTDGPTWRRLRKTQVDLRRVVIHDVVEDDPGPACYWGDYHVTTQDFSSAPFEPPPLAERSRDDVAAIVYSSGTSGRPKGCLLSHGNYLSQMQALGNLYPMQEDDVYLSILPTNHALDFMCGFLVPLLCGARVVHLRTLRPEWILGALKDQGVTHMSAVPALLEALVRRVREKLADQPPVVDAGLRGLKALNGWLTRRRPNHIISKTLLLPVHEGLGGRLRRIFAGGAFVPAATARALYELGIPVAIGYGLTEACAVVSVNDLEPFRDDTVGPPVPGTELQLRPRDARGRGEVWVKGPQVFLGYEGDAELTAETLQDGWLRTGDLGEIDAAGHLRLVGRIKDMIVTAGGKNVYPQDVEGKFHGVPCEELAVLSSHRIWSSQPGQDESLVLVLRPKDDPEPALAELAKRNRRLPAFQRVVGVLLVERAFPRTTSLKLKRADLAAELTGRDKTELRRL